MWRLVGVGLLVPLDYALALGVTLVWEFTAPVLLVALWCDYRQAQSSGECNPGVQAYVENIGHDVSATVTRRDSLGSGREAIRSC